MKTKASKVEQGQAGKGAGRSPWILAVISTLLQFLIFPSPGQYWLGWIAMAPLLVALVQVAERQPKASFAVAYLSGILWHASTCVWIVHAMHAYGGIPLPLSVGILFLYALYLGLYHGAFGLAFVFFVRRFSAAKALLLAPFLWVALELVRARFTNVPWNLLGYSQVDNIPLGRLAMFTGVFGLSFAIFAVNGLFALAFVNPGYRTLPAICAVLLATGMECGNLVHVPEERASETAVLMQGNLQLDTDWTPEYESQTVNSFMQISLNDSHGTNLIVWPEQPAPPFQENNPAFRYWMSSLAQQSHDSLILGNISFTPKGPPNEWYMYNSASQVTPQGRFVARYDKIHLVPWGEYVPYQDFFFFAHKLTRDVGNFSRGTERKVFDIAGHKMGAFICYEAVFGNEVRQFAANGAEVLVNISNDGWFGGFAAPRQHFNMARMRAIENHRWLLRDTNSGITASIDPEGRVVAELPSDRRATLRAPYAYAGEVTFYTRHGDVFAFSCAIITLVALCAACVPRRKTEG